MDHGGIETEWLQVIDHQGKPVGHFGRILKLDVMMDSPGRKG